MRIYIATLTSGPKWLTIVRIACLDALTSEELENTVVPVSLELMKEEPLGISTVSSNNSCLEEYQSKNNTA